jgi:hypothetical protein
MVADVPPVPAVATIQDGADRLVEPCPVRGVAAVHVLGRGRQDGGVQGRRHAGVRLLVDGHALRPWPQVVHR